MSTALTILLVVAAAVAIWTLTTLKQSQSRTKKLRDDLAERRSKLQQLEKEENEKVSKLIREKKGEAKPTFSDEQLAILERATIFRGQPLVVGQVVPGSRFYGGGPQTDPYIIPVIKPFGR